MSKNIRVFINITSRERVALNRLVKRFGSSQRLFDLVALRCELLSRDEKNQTQKPELEVERNSLDAVEISYNVNEKAWARINEAAYRLNVDRNVLVGFILMGIEKQERELRRREIEQAADGDSLFAFLDAYRPVTDSMLERANTDWAWIKRGMLHYERGGESAEFRRHPPFASHP